MPIFSEPIPKLINDCSIGSRRKDLNDCGIAAEEPRHSPVAQLLLAAQDDNRNIAFASHLDLNPAAPRRSDSRNNEKRRTFAHPLPFHRINFDRGKSRMLHRIEMLVRNKCTRTCYVPKRTGKRFVKSFGFPSVLWRQLGERPADICCFFCFQNSPFLSRHVRQLIVLNFRWLY